MCINAPISLITGLTSLGICAFLIYRNNPYDRFIGITFIFVSLMQIVEFLMWIDQKCYFLNNIASKLGFILLWFQTFIFTVMSLFESTLIPKIFLGCLALFLSLPLVLSILFVLQQPNKSKLWCTHPGPNCHLHWSFFKYYDSIPTFLKLNWRYWLAFIPIFIIRPFRKSLILGTILLLSLFYSLYTYGKSGEYGTIWCWVVNFILILFIFINKTSKKTNDEKKERINNQK